MKLEIMDGGSGWHFVVDPSVRENGGTIAEFPPAGRSDAELFVLAKEGQAVYEALLAANPWPRMEDVGTPEYDQAIRNRILGPSSTLCTQCGEQPRFGPYKYCQSCFGKFQGSQPPIADAPLSPVGIHVERELAKLKSRPWDAGKYYAIADVSTGSGFAPSTLSVHGFAHEQVYFFSDLDITPEDFADLCVAVCRHIHNAELKWENHGPGVSFGRRVWKELGYENCYFRKAPKSPVGKTSHEYAEAIHADEPITVQAKPD